MTENKHTSNPQDFDEQLARFTDDLLDGGEPDMMTQDQELQELMLMAQTLRQTLGGRQAPDTVLSERIKRQIEAEWEQSQQQTRRSWWQQIIPAAQPRPEARPRRTRQPAFTFAMAMAAVILIMFICPLALSADFSGTLAGSAGGSEATLPLILIGMLAGVGVLLWLTRNRE